jgi:predicted TIM-barrel fold metal-dependent hydrolase
MIIDCHTHIHVLDDAETPKHLATTETVDAAIVLAGPGGPRDEANAKVADYVSQHAEQTVGFAVVDPTIDAIDEKHITALLEKTGLKGFVVYCAIDRFHPAHSRAMRFYEVSEARGLPVFFHNGSHALSSNAALEYVQPYLLDEVARSFPGLKMVIGNMGLPFIDQTLAIVAKHQNVFADLTIRPSKVWQTYNIVVAAYERDVMDGLLFGSGFPLGSAGDCIETLLGFNMLLGDTRLPNVPRGSIRNVIERDSLELLGIEHEQIKAREHREQAPGGQDQ